MIDAITRLPEGAIFYNGFDIQLSKKKHKFKMIDCKMNSHSMQLYQLNHSNYVFPAYYKFDHILKEIELQAKKMINDENDFSLNGFILVDNKRLYFSFYNFNCTGEFL